MSLRTADTVSPTGTSLLQPRAFPDAFTRFKRLIAANDSGNPFTSFQEGIVGAWENYKPRLREHALQLLAAHEWAESSIGSGAILQQAIQAIEIQDNRRNLINNLCRWQNRYGHANRDHRVMLEAADTPKLRRDLEGLLFGLYRGEADEGFTFERLTATLGAKYPLLAYLYFLKDSDRFMPIAPTTFDAAFQQLGIDLVTLRNCSWVNYELYNQVLCEVRNALAAERIPNVRLIDAHSFCWMLERLPDPESDRPRQGDKAHGRILEARKRSIAAMAYAAESAARYSNGQTAQRKVKNKELRMSRTALEQLLDRLLAKQENRCALTGIPFVFHGPGADTALIPSLDRIDSNGHYEEGNLQIVCQFINFWKGDSDNEEFKRLIMLVRGEVME
jgi:hypothetical protein